MGLRYSSEQNQWLRDSSFMDRTFIEFRDEDGNWHGPGGGQSQNSYRTLLNNFGLGAPAFTGNLAAVDASHPGVVSIATSSAADEISIVELVGGVVEISINGQYYTVLGGLEQVIIDTLGDQRDQVRTAGDLTFELIVDGSTPAHTKLDAVSQSGPGLGCSCPMCTAALDGALANEEESFALVPGLAETDFVVGLPKTVRFFSDARRDEEDLLEQWADQQSSESTSVIESGLRNRKQMHPLAVPQPLWGLPESRNSM